MMSFEDFERQVRVLLNNDGKWMHILPSIEPQLRGRFLKILGAGIDMPLAFDLVLITKDLDDAGFEVKWKQLRSKT